MTAITWFVIKEDARNISKNELTLASTLEKFILNHNSFHSSLASILAYKFSDIIGYDDWLFLFNSKLENVSNKSAVSYRGEDLLKLTLLSDVALYDLGAIRENDFNLTNYTNILLYHHGYLALQAYRISHQLWFEKQYNIALSIQSRCKQLFNINIHPSAKLDPAIYLHNSGTITISESVSIGAYSILYSGVVISCPNKNNTNVTLYPSLTTTNDVSSSNTSTTSSSRHLVLGEAVLVGYNACILGSLTIGDYACISSGSVLYKSIPSHCTVIGNPGRIIGTRKRLADNITITSEGTRPSNTSGSVNTYQSIELIDTVSKDGDKYQDTYSISYDNTTVYQEIDIHRTNKLHIHQINQVLCLQFGTRTPLPELYPLFTECDEDKDGYLSQQEYMLLVSRLVASHTTSQLTTSIVSTSTDWATSLISSAFGNHGS